MIIPGDNTPLFRVGRGLQFQWYVVSKETGVERLALKNSTIKNIEWDNHERVGMWRIGTGIVYTLLFATLMTIEHLHYTLRYIHLTLKIITLVCVCLTWPLWNGVNFDTDVRSLVLLGLVPLTVTLAMIGLFCNGPKPEKKIYDHGPYPCHKYITFSYIHLG